jgi:hypothetical protein
MAEQLTDAEITALRTIIGAFQNGKRITDLPTTDTVQDLTMMVVDKDGETKKIAVSKLMPYAENELAYGIKWNTFNTTSDRGSYIKRVGNMDLHKADSEYGLPIQNQMYGGAWSDTGELVERYNANSWIGNTRDGSKGQSEVNIPDYFYKFTCVLLSDKSYDCTLMISQYPLIGYNKMDRFLYSPWCATLARAINGVTDSDTGKLCSVVSTDEKYRGGLAGADLDDFTLLGKPRTGLSRLNYRTYSHNRGAGWNGELYQARKSIFILYAVEYANFNIQDDYNPVLTSEGYRQGGLGSGVTDISSAKWSAISAYQPLIPNGVTDSLGNGSGVVAYTVTRTNSTTGVTTSHDFKVPRYRGIENFYGSIWTWIDYINLLYTKETVNGTEVGKINAYVCDDTSLHKTNDDASYNSAKPIPDGYRYIGEIPNTSGYIKNLVLGDMDIIAGEIGNGASSNNCYGDYCYVIDWFHKNSSGEYDQQASYNNILRGLLSGGTADAGASAGCVCASAGSVPTNTCAYLGSRLCFSLKNTRR